MGDAGSTHFGARAAAGTDVKDPVANLWTRLHFAWFVVVGFVITVPCALLQVISHNFRPTAANFKVWSGLWARLILTVLGVRVHVEDEAALEPGKPYVFISNHQNLLDILVLAGYLPHAFGFIAKKELARVPALGLAIRYSASIFLDRSDPRKAVESLKQAGERIRGGTSVLLFAEGTRSYGPYLQPLKKGAFMVAVEAGVPVVPVVVVDGYRLMHEKRKVSRPGHLTLVVRRPVDISGMSRKHIPELIALMRDQLDEPLQRHRSEALSSATSPSQ